MIVVLTYIRLKSFSNIIRFFKLNSSINKQLKNSNFLDYKTGGFWTKYYTMTLWMDKQDMQSFSRNGAHLEAMRQSKNIAKEVKSMILESNKLPSWKEAKGLLSTN